MTMTMAMKLGRSDRGTKKKKENKKENVEEGKGYRKRDMTCQRRKEWPEEEAANAVFKCHFSLDCFSSFFFILFFLFIFFMGEV